MKMEMENTCTKCDCTISTVCNAEDFWAHKVGRVRCPECGAIVMPCNECAAETPIDKRDCDNCPWKRAKILEEKNDVFIKQSDIFKMVEETNGFKQNQKVTGWHYSGDDEIVFDTNKTSHETEHYTLIEFVAQVDANFKEANDMKCNQFGAEVRDGVDGFFFYFDAGATPCHKE